MGRPLAGPRPSGSPPASPATCPVSSVIGVLRFGGIVTLLLPAPGTSVTSSAANRGGACAVVHRRARFTRGTGTLRGVSPPGLRHWAAARSASEAACRRGRRGRLRWAPPRAYRLRFAGARALGGKPAHGAPRTRAPLPQSLGLQDAAIALPLPGSPRLLRGFCRQIALSVAETLQ